jgi:hypothetical protein
LPEFIIISLIFYVLVPKMLGLGVIYWEPEGEKSWSGYSAVNFPELRN